MNSPIHTIDLNFLDNPRTIAVYAVPHAGGLALVECGPGSTLAALQAGLEGLGCRLEQVTDLLLTHIHLDHAGAAGALARRGVRVHVHPNGAPHLVNPEKLLNSASRIYGDQMERLWGEFLPVPEAMLSIPQDGREIIIGGKRFIPLDTPGHAEHHYAYLFEDACFTGDISGVRLPGPPYLRAPMPPPDFHLEKWLASVEKLRRAGFRRMAPTHFGFYEDVAWHLDAMTATLQAIDAWLSELMPGGPSQEALNARFLAWMEAQASEAGLSPAIRQAYEAANPSWMSAAGMERYWRKYRA
jgi:glyoxylase-like metal-dependent hydrolase (beta-lactamase superfamily II)